MDMQLRFSFARSLAARRRGVTLLELMIILVAVAVVFLIALPTLKPTEEEETIERAKEHLLYIHAREQEYFAKHGKYAPLSAIAADPDLSANLDSRFATDDAVVDGINFIGPKVEGVIYDALAELPDGSRYRVDQTGQVTQLDIGD